MRETIRHAPSGGVKPQIVGPKCARSAATWRNYGLDVSPDLISAVAGAVLEEVTQWQNRPPDVCYPLVFIDAVRVKIRDEGFVRNKAVHIALAIRPDGTSEILGIQIERTESARFWLRVMNEFNNRGVGATLSVAFSNLRPPGSTPDIAASWPRRHWISVLLFAQRAVLLNSGPRWRWSL